ncbi:pyridoxamine 5'-phosphate oxidase family protein [Nocardioides dongxiaopingii]|uniref:MSMEG_1061 family FMN-dependent PPOX-type flavoprotein n=1 Tax=Nocardioides sp. S-1144 TaxID=2582905 RepID=UPI00110E1BB0|nr:MSMEG_1061 family FMN-dependent PPOX-type flavoprotein [Nocardioides sp. S-1144]QCW51110.1 pyridoxamine 5'-phosphate oxidase family protein [Nocardioides sp. S-1144]
MSEQVVRDAASLRRLVAAPVPRVAAKVRSELGPVDLDFLARSPFCIVATSDVDGNADASPKGDPPGFCHVLDERTIAIPERAGNRRLDGYLNVLTNPHVGLVFLVPGRGDTLRINGTATVVSDADWFSELRVNDTPPLLALKVAVEEVFFHCSKAFLRSRLWNPESWDPQGAPSPATILRTVLPADDPLVERADRGGDFSDQELYPTP